MTSNGTVMLIVVLAMVKTMIFYNNRLESVSISAVNDCLVCCAWYKFSLECDGVGDVLDACCDKVIHLYCY